MLGKHKIIPSFLVLLSVLVACNTAHLDTETESITIGFTSAAQPWVTEIQACANLNSIIVDFQKNSLLDANNMMSIRIGESLQVATTIYQVANTEITIIANSHNPVQSLTREEARAIFNGTISNWNQVSGGVDAPIQVWTYPRSTDIHEAFQYYFMGEYSITHQALVTNDYDNMIAVVSSEPGAVGFIVGAVFSDEISTLYTIESVPVVAFLHSEPDNEIRQLLLCAQTRNR
ncbi:MAG: substrate-binding domain-containing protein [Chloroflexota bacterium]